MWIPNRVASLTPKGWFKSYEGGLLVEVQASFIDECFPFIRPELP